MAARRTVKRTQPVVCRDCKILCTPDDLCQCCIAIRNSREDDR